MKAYVVAFLRAILAGVLTACALPFLFGVVFVISLLTEGEPSQALGMLYVFLVVVASITALIAGVSLFVGLPISYGLRRLGRYSSHAHVGAGVVLGFITFPAFFAVSGGQEADTSLLLLYIYAALAGGVTANIWWFHTSAITGLDVTPA